MVPAGGVRTSRREAGKQVLNELIAVRGEMSARSNYRFLRDDYEIALVHRHGHAVWVGSVLGSRSPSMHRSTLNRSQDHNVGKTPERIHFIQKPADEPERRRYCTSLCHPR